MGRLTSITLTDALGGTAVAPRRFAEASAHELAGCRLDPRDARDEVLALALERAAAGSLPAARSDPHLLCLAIEGGGMRGSVTAGMCVVLEAAGLVASFDRIYGCSAGALNGAFTASGQTRLGATTYADSAERRFIDLRRLIRGSPVVDLDLLFDELLAARRPFSAAGLARGPEFRAVAMSPRDGGVRVLSDFRDTGELLGAVRASCAVPMMSGEPPLFRGERLLDGGFVESVPYRAALREGATHVLVLRSRPAAYRLAPVGRLVELAARQMHPDLASVVAARPQRYNDEADELVWLSSQPPGHPPVAQVDVAPSHRLVDHLSTDLESIAASMRLGATAMASLVLREPASLSVACPPLDAAA